MRKYFRLVLVLGCSLPLLAVASVAAEGTTTTTTTDKTTTTQTPTTSDSGKGQLITDRIKQREANEKTKLTTIQATHLETVCKIAQGHADGVNTKAQTLGSDRDKLYGDIITRLNDLVTKLKAKNVDTTQLSAEITSLQTDINTFNADVATYKQDVSDLVGMDCVSDPSGFQATLDTARTDRDRVLQDSTAIKSYVDNTIKPTLQQIRTQLAPTTSTNTKTGE